MPQLRHAVALLLCSRARVMHESQAEPPGSGRGSETDVWSEERAVSVIRAEVLRNEIRRLRAGVSRLFHADAPAPEEPNDIAFQPRLTIRDIMQTNLSTIRPESPLGPAVTMMIEKEVSSLPVVDALGRVVGALNQKDVLKVFYNPDATTVGSVMTTDPIVMSIGAPLIDVIDELMSSDFRRVLIHEDDRLVGVVVRTHLLPVVLLAIEEVATRQTAPPETAH
jgi:CBS domain-containing protein